MRRKKKVLFGIVMTMIFLIGFALSFEQKVHFEMQPCRSNQIAVYIQEETGEYRADNTDKFPTSGYILNTEKSVCQNGSVLSQDETTKMISLSTPNNESCTLYFDKEVFNVPKAVNSILNNKPVAGVNIGNPTFANAATTDEGVYAMADDYGMSYYYRGAVENNYVKFAGFYWRVIRVNGNGSLRIIYDGTSAHANSENSADRFVLRNQSFSDGAGNYLDGKYMGWMYGPTGTTSSTSYAQATTNAVSSNIKTQVDNWYKTNVVDAGYGGAVEDTLFCNDRSLGGSDDEYTNLGYGGNMTNYAAATRLISDAPGFTSMNPQFTCPRKNDAFTVGDKIKGNGDLTYPVGLITADEMAAAGGGKNNVYYYLYKYGYSLEPIPVPLINYSLTMTPSSIGRGGYLYIFTIGSSNIQNAGLPMGDIAPVINLKANYVSTMTGTGTMDDPYTV